MEMVVVGPLLPNYSLFISEATSLFIIHSSSSLLEAAPSPYLP